MFKPRHLVTFLRFIELPKEMADWSLNSLQLKLIEIGARVALHARAITYQLAEVAVTGPMVRTILAPSADCERHRDARDREPGPN